MISALLALLFPAILAGGPGGTATTLAEVAGASAALARPSAVVDARYAGADGALVGGVPTFRTITAAVAAAPLGSSAYVVYIKDGRYREKLQVNRAHVTFRGESRTGTVMTWDDNADTRGPDGQPLGTRGTWTLKATAPDFHLERLTVENAFDYMTNYRKAPSDSTKVRNAQGLALALTDSSDRAVLHDCVLTGNQDTFFADAGRTYVRGCTIVGNVDFIFGAGRVVFEDDDIVSLDRGVPKNNGYITAASTPKTRKYGFVFLRSRLRKQTPAMAPGSVFLGRPWHPGADANVNSAAVFIDCRMDDHIPADGWTRMSSVDANQTRIWYEPAESRFFEYGSRGPGALPGPGRRELTPEQAKEYTVEQVLDGWNPG